VITHLIWNGSLYILSLASSTLRLKPGLKNRKFVKPI
jgi:hypothetical protein